MSRFNDGLSGQDLHRELQAQIKLLSKALLSHRRRGQKFALSRREYQVALAKEMLLQRNAGLPVTILSDICKGNEEIADLRMKKDIAESAYKTAAEAIMVYKINVRILEAEISREWGQAK